MLAAVMIESLLFVLFVCIVPINSISHDEAKLKLLSALQMTESIVQKLFDRWQINDFPNFLTSASMSHTSYEVLKVKYQLKILQTLTATKEEEIPKFVISFLGSSVTAGHDTLFNISVSQLTENVMTPAFDELGVKLVVINGAMGNNRCLPYDACVKVFASPESDIIQWEQGYDCFGTNQETAYIFEEFLRQSAAMKSKPIVIFSGSFTTNWPASDCAAKLPKPVPSAEDLKYLDILRAEKSVKNIVTARDGVSKEFSALAPLSHHYVMAAIQYWDHSTYEANKCHGPFVAEWGCCAAPWHPSILGHEIRSAHYSFFWLMIYQDAIRAILTGISAEKQPFTRDISAEEQPFVSNITTTGHTLQELKDKLFKHYHHARKFPEKPIFPSNIPENVQCLTSYEPIIDQTSNLANWVIDNKGPNTKYFVRDIFENLHRTEIVVHARAGGYKDFKYGFYGNNDSKPLSIKIDVKALGTTQICVPPPVGNFDQNLAIHPFWRFNAKIYLRTDVADWDKLSPFKEDINGTFIPDPNGKIFDHQVEHSKLLSYNNVSDVNQVCLALKDHIPIGRHVLSIVATTADNIFISTLLIP